MTTTNQKAVEDALLEASRYLDGGGLQDESTAQHEEDEYSSSDGTYYSPNDNEESSYSVDVDTDDDSSFSENVSNDNHSDKNEGLSGKSMRNTTQEGRQSQSQSQSMRGREVVSDSELSSVDNTYDDDDDAASRSHSSRSSEESSSSTNKDDSKGGGSRTTSSQFDEWGSFGLNGGKSSFVNDVNFNSIDDGNSNGEAAFFSNNNTFETTNHNNIGFEDAFGGDPFAEKAGAPQNTDEKYSFESASNKKDSIVVGGTDNSAAAALEIDPFASGGFPHNKISVVEDEDRNNDDDDNNSDGDEDEDEEAFFVEENNKTDAFFHQSDGTSRRISSQAGDDEEEPLFPTTTSVNRDNNKNEDFSNDSERGTPLNSTSQDENGNAQFLGNRTIDVNQTKSSVVQESNDKYNDSFSENQKVYTANDGEPTSELDTNNEENSPSDSSSRNTEDSGVKEPMLLHHEPTQKIVSNVNEISLSQLPLDASEDSGPSDFEFNYSKPLDYREEEDSDSSNEEEKESFQSSHSGEENNRSFHGDDDEESGSIHHKKKNSGPKPNANDFSDSISSSIDDFTSTYSGDEATKPREKAANQVWNDSFDGSERSRPRSLNDEADEPSSSREDPKSKAVIDGDSESFNASFCSDEHSYSESLANATDEAPNAAFENDKYPQSKPLIDDIDESTDNSKRSKSASVVDVPIKSDDASFVGHDCSGSSAIRDGTDESGNSDFDGSQHSSSKPPEEDANESSNDSFYSSESSRSLREPLNGSFENFEHYQDKPGDSWDPKFDNNEHSETKLSREDVEAPNNDSSCSSGADASFFSVFDGPEHSGSESQIEETNGPCSLSSFDGSEFSRSLRMELKESSDHSTKGSAEESRNSALETSEVSRSESFKEEDNESNDSSCDSHENSRSGSLKRAANESQNSAFDGSRSESMQDRSNGSRNSSDNTTTKSFENDESRVENSFANNNEETSSHELSHHNSVESGRSFGQSEDPFQHQDSKLPSTDTEKSERSSESSTSTGYKDDENRGKQNFSVTPETDAPNQNSTFGSSNDTTLQSSSTTQSSVSQDDIHHEDSFATSNVKRQQKLAKYRNSTSNEVGENSEASMMIGEVFGQPNELFEDFNKRDRSFKNSSGLPDYRSQRKSEKDLIIHESEEDLDSNDTHSSDTHSSDTHSSDTHSKDTHSKDTYSKDTYSNDDTRSNDTPSKDTRSKGTHSKDTHSKDTYSNDTRSKDTYSNDTPSEISQNEFQNRGNKGNGDIKTNKDTKILSEKERRKKKKRKKQRRRRNKEAKSAALLDFAANVNETILGLEDRSESNEENNDSSAHRLLHTFDALLGIFLKLSDELELIATFSEPTKTSVVHVSALTAILGFAETFDQLFTDLKPVILDCFEEEPDQYKDNLFQRLDALIDLLCETTHRVGERQEWNCRVHTTYATLLELIERDSLDLRCYYDDVDTPDPGVSANVHEAWSATGHIEELKALQRNDDPQLFRQICYEVMVSTDQWCPDTGVLMEICDIDPDMLEEQPPQEYIDEDELAPIPEAAENILGKINGKTLRRLDSFASILRRILPPRAVIDASLLSHFTSIRNSIESPLGLSATNVVSISSVPESLNDPNALGVAGVGKTTLAAMVAEHPDVRRYFIDGVAWIYLGDQELNYNRYTLCLRELVAQLDFYDGIPLFAELLHTPGDNFSKRKRREEGFMIYARDTIADLLKDRSVLIILDDVCFEPDMDWFDFAPMPDESTHSQGDNCALVITTRRRFLLPAADTVEIDMLDEADAITLLIQESGQLSHTLMAESKEARSVVRECANHPLAVKSIGRWLNLKHATAGVTNSVEEIHSEVIKSMDKILKSGDNTGTDMMYEILSTSLSPAINGGPTNIIKFCFAAFIMVFCDRNHFSEFELTEPNPIIPMNIAELLFQTLLETYEVSLLKKGSLFYAQKKEAAVLIPEALSALGILKVITYDAEEDPDDEQKYLQVMHSIHHEYGVYLAHDDLSLKDFTKDAERQWNRALVDAYLSHVREWDWDLEEVGHCYMLEMIVSHMIRGAMYNVAANLLAEKTFIRGRLRSLGRDNCTKRHIKDCEMLCKKLKERVPRDSNLQALHVMKHVFQALGRELTINTEKYTEDAKVKNVEVARAHSEIGFSLSENRCWDAAIAHWEISQELLMLSLGSVEVVAGILYNIGVVYSELNEYEQALNNLKQCLKIRLVIHGEDHILYAQTIQKIGDVFLNVSDYHEAMESYNWALGVMYKEPDHHYIEIGEILDNKGTIHYSKGEVDEALQCHQEALRSKQEDLGEDHPELAATYHNIGNCLSDQGNIDDAIVHFEEAIRLKELDPEGGPENDADVLTIEGILNNLEGNQDQGLECYERSLQILVTKVPYRKEKIASLLHLIGCVYLMSGEQRKAMKLFEESLRARRKVLGFVHLDVASTLFNMAFLYQTRNRLDKALRCLEEVLKIRQLRLPDSEKVAVTHEKIGSLAKGIGKAKKAQIAFEEALKIRKSIHGPQHEAVATVVQELGDLMDDLGEHESAMTFYIDALEVRRSCLGVDDIAVAETLYSMGYTLHNTDEPDRALACFVEALSIRRHQLGEDSMEVGDTLNMMGFLKAKRGELDDALTLLWDALRIRKLQEDHIKVSETLKNIGNVHREKDELELALECYEECLRIRRFELGPNHEKVADVLVAMGSVHNENPLKAEEAKQLYKEALDIRKHVLGEHDESVAVVLQYMGTIEFRANNHARARDLLTEFIQIRRDNDAKNDGNYVNVLYMIGNIHKMEGNEVEAKLCWNEAYQVFQQYGLAESNPQIVEAMTNLVEENKIDEQDTVLQNKKSLFGIVTEKFKKDTPDDGLYQKGLKTIRRKGLKL